MRYEKPPIGVQPSEFAIEIQIIKLCEAIARYMESPLTGDKLEVVARWADELKVLLTALEQLNALRKQE